IDPDTPDQPRTTTAEQPPNGSSSPSPSLSPLAEAITTSLRVVARAVAREPVPADPAAHAAAVKAAEHATDKATTKAAHAVFTVGGARTGKTTTAGTRPPTAAERTAARVLAR